MADIDSELKSSIHGFEQILTVLPEDRVALEFLCHAYDETGDREKFLEHAITLSEVVLREKEIESAAALIEKLQTFDDPRAKTVVLRLQVMMAPQPDLRYEEPGLCETSASPAVAAKAELDLLNRLVSEGVLVKTLVMSAFDQLENLPSSGGDFLISALQILEKENLTVSADALVAVAAAAETPLVPLDSFELSPANVSNLPERLVRVRGVVPFARLGDDWLVAVLNPFDEALKNEIEAAMKAKCHFFMAAPMMIEKALTRLLSAHESRETRQSAADASPAAVPEPIAPEPPPAANLLGMGAPAVGRGNA